MGIASTPLISLRQVAKRFESGLLALDDISLDVQAGDFVTLLGPSGCGKSTILRLVADLMRPTTGELTSPAQQDRSGRSTAFVFQEPTLMPWATVFDNVWLPLRLQGQGASEASAVINRVLKQVGLSDFSRSYPEHLSGGMKMRVSIARALVTQPQVLLMDEPFAALDDLTRLRLNDELLEWWGSAAMTALFVTHNVSEAVFLSQRVVVMGARPGKIVAEVQIEQAYPRDASFRESLPFLRYCQQLTAALTSAASAAVSQA